MTRARTRARSTPEPVGAILPRVLFAILEACAHGEEERCPECSPDARDYVSDPAIGVPEDLVL